MLYFAYGSNLDEAQMHDRCPSAVRGPRAVLRGYALTFGGFSHRWGGAVASIVRAPGAAVHGLLYRIDLVDVGRLDRLEGHPFAYERVERIVIDEDGRRRRTHLYLQPEGGFEPWEPAPDYYAVMRRAYARLGFDRQRLARIAGGSMSRGVGQRGASTVVFVYGTLLQGEGNHHLLADARFLGPARTPPRFALHDLGAFPGLVAGGEKAVEGEVYIVGPDTLARLDQLEGHPNWYRRAPIALEDGTTVETYLLPPDCVAGRRVIASGSWRARRKERFG